VAFTICSWATNKKIRKNNGYFLQCNYLSWVQDDEYVGENNGTAPEIEEPENPCQSQQAEEDKRPSHRNSETF
jgi:hypothetical protein